MPSLFLKYPSALSFLLFAVLAWQILVSGGHTRKLNRVKNTDAEPVLASLSLSLLPLDGSNTLSVSPELKYWPLTRTYK